MKNEGYNKGLAIGLTIGFLLSAMIYEQFAMQRQEDVAGVYVQATVLKVILDDDPSCAGKCVGYKYPKDKSVVRIDNIKKNFFALGKINLKAGDEFEHNLLFSARPARLVADGSLKNISAHKYLGFLAAPIPVENGYFIYKLPIKKKSERVLPGLKEGDRIIIKDYNPVLYIGEYGVVKTNSS